MRTKVGLLFIILTFVILWSLVRLNLRYQIVNALEENDYIAAKYLSFTYKYAFLGDLKEICNNPRSTTKLFDNEEFRSFYNKLLNKYYKTNISDQPKIPYITHNIWITNPKNPRAPEQVHIDTMLNTLASLDKEGMIWQHFFWVNKKGLFPALENYLSEYGVVIREFSEIEHYEPNIPYFLKALEINPVVLADYMRLILLQNYGGLYMDLDVAITQFSFVKQLHTYLNLYTTDFGKINSCLCNGFIAASIKHPRIERAVKIAHNNIDSTIFSSYPVRYSCDKDLKVGFIAGACMFNQAFIIEPESDTNIDIVFPFQSFFSDLGNSDSNTVININDIKIKPNVIGVYGLSGSWLEKTGIK